MLNIKNNKKINVRKYFFNKYIFQFLLKKEDIFNIYFTHNSVHKRKLCKNIIFYIELSSILTYNVLFL